MGSTATTARRSAPGLVGVALLAVTAFGGSVMAQSAAPIPVGSTEPSPAASAGPDTGRQVEACGPRGMREMRRLRRAQERGRLRVQDRARPRLWERLQLRPDRQGWPGPDRRQDRAQRVPRLAVVRALSRVATVSAIDGNVLTLVTRDGWSRTLDTTGIAITRGRAPITIADVAVGNDVRVLQRRTDDGTLQVTGVRVLLTTALGLVASVTPNGFELTTARGLPVSVRVSESTTWVTPCEVVGGLDTLKVGSAAIVRGVRAADGSIDATVVATADRRRGRPDRRERTRRVPVLPTPEVATASPAPAMSPAPASPSA